MRLFRKLAVAALVAVLTSASALAQAHEPRIPSFEDVRQQYLDASSDWSTIPELVMQAFVAAEDRHYFEGPVQRSTITQQITLWALPPQTGRLVRLAFSGVLGAALSHDEALAWYVNAIFLGQACFGVTDAALAYFGRPLENLTLAEIAFLAGLPKAPSMFHPIKSYDRAVARRNFVLSQMQVAGFISPAEADRALRTELVVREPLARCEGDQ